MKSRTISYTALSSIDRYKLKGLNELVETQNAMWFGDYSMTNLAFIFQPEELMSGRLPALNGMQNLFLACYKELDRQYIDVGTFKFFLLLLDTHIAYLVQSHIFSQRLID